MRDVLSEHRVKDPLDRRYYNTHYVRQTSGVNAMGSPSVSAEASAKPQLYSWSRR